MCGQDERLRRSVRPRYRQTSQINLLNLHEKTPLKHPFLLQKSHLPQIWVPIQWRWRCHQGGTEKEVQLGAWISWDGKGVIVEDVGRDQAGKGEEFEAFAQRGVEEKDQGKDQSACVGWGWWAGGQGWCMGLIGGGSIGSINDFCLKFIGVLWRKWWIEIK